MNARVQKILATALIFVMGSQLFATELSNNFAIIDSLVCVQSHLFSKYCKNHNYKRIKLNVNGSSGSSFVEDRLMKAINQDSLLLSLSNTGSGLFKINIINIGVRYGWADNDYTKIKRTITSDIAFYEYNNDSSKICPINIAIQEYSDTLSSAYVDFIQSGDYDFAKSTLPPKNKSFLDEIIEPVLVVGSVVLTVILLFSVRSK